MSWWEKLAQGTSSRAFQRACDISVVVLWAALGWIMFIGRYRGEFPFLDLDSDTAQIASFAAAQSNPGAFAGDFLLGDPRNYEFYFTLQIPLARALGSLVGDLGLAFILPLPILLSLQGFGFYFLGRTLCGSRAYGLLFSVAALPVIRFSQLADYWGTRGFTMPRDWFQALLPYVLVLALTKGSQKRGRFLIMAATGALIYVHPVSTPPWACAIWLGLWWSLPSTMTVRQRAAEMGLLAGVFVLVSAPFFVRFLAGGRQDPVPAAQVLEAFTYRYQPGYLDLSLTLNEVSELMLGSWTLYFAGLGAYVLWTLRAQLGYRLRVVASWLAGLLFIGVVVVWVDQTLAARAGRVPFQLDLIRSVRYLLPFCWLLGFWALSQLALKTKYRAIRAIGLSTAAAFVCSLFVRYPAPDFLSPGWEFVKAGEYVPSQPGPTPLHQALDAAKLTPPGSKFFATNMQDASLLRYQALRPVVYSFKDGGALGYSNHRALVAWYGREKVFTSLMGRQDKWRVHSIEVPADRMVEIARAWGADYIFFPGQLMTPAGTHRVYENSLFTLIKL